MVASGILAGACCAMVSDVDHAEEQLWLRYTLPLPHVIAIRKKVVVAPAEIAIRMAESAGEIERTAVAELREFLRERTGIEPAVFSTRPARGARIVKR